VRPKAQSSLQRGTGKYSCTLNTKDSPYARGENNAHASVKTQYSLKTELNYEFYNRSAMFWSYHQHALLPCLHYLPSLQGEDNQNVTNFHRCSLSFLQIYNTSKTSFKLYIVITCISHMLCIFTLVFSIQCHYQKPLIKIQRQK